MKLDNITIKERLGINKVNKEINKMNLVMYPNKNDYKNSSPKASISVSGLIRINSIGTKNFNMRSYERCVLFYTSEEKIIAIKLSNDKNDPTTLSLRKQGVSTEIFIKKFLQYFNISINKTSSYEVKLENEYIVIDLNKEVTPWGKKEK